MKVPCEVIIWYLLPAIRKEIIKSMIKEHDMNQRKTAKMLGLSDAAVSQYLGKKRANLEIKDKEVLEAIGKAADRIVNGGDDEVSIEICNLCNLIRNRTDIVEKLDK
jgi:predicted transcriptional regulator